jgi:type III restriction enzyme
MLQDGRALAVEYKGWHLWAEAEDKRAVGTVWESRSGGRCLFSMPSEENSEAIKQKLFPGA